jgi:hypothetical protein
MVQMPHVHNGRLCGTKAFSLAVGTAARQCAWVSGRSGRSGRLAAVKNIFSQERNCGRRRRVRGPICLGRLPPFNCALGYNRMSSCLRRQAGRPSLHPFRSDLLRMFEIQLARMCAPSLPETFGTDCFRRRRQVRPGCRLQAPKWIAGYRQRPALMRQE